MEKWEWAEIVDWISDRFNRPWTQRQVEAFYKDLRIFSYGEVKEAVHGLYARGLTRPPSGSQIMALVKELAHAAGERDKLPMNECNHYAMDDEGYCTACGGVPKLGKLMSELDELTMADVTSVDPKDRKYLTTVVGYPPEDVY